MTMPRRSLIIGTLAVIFFVFGLADVSAAAGKAPVKKPAATEPPMRVYIVRSAAEGCEPNCLEWIAAQGRIDAGTLERFKKVLGQLGKRNLPVLVQSGGGMAYEALAIGRLLRKRGLDVAVSRTVFAPCAPDAAACLRKDPQKALRGKIHGGFAYCASSCGFLLAAGTRRYVGVGSFVGVHAGEMIQKKVLHTFRMTPYRAEDGSVRYKKRLISEKIVGERHRSTPDSIFDLYERYFAEMGIGMDIMRLMVETPNSTIHWLTRDELRSTGIATHRMGGEQLIAGEAAPGNGWTVPVAGHFQRVPGAPSQECTLSGAGCQWELKSPVAIAPVKGTPAPPPSATQECAKSDAACTFHGTPSAPIPGTSVSQPKAP